MHTQEAERADLPLHSNIQMGNSEAIRLPKDVAFGEGAGLVIGRSGDVMTIYPAVTSIGNDKAPAFTCRLRRPSSGGTTRNFRNGRVFEPSGALCWTPMSPCIFAMASPVVTENVAALDGAVLMSIVTRVELEGGVHREPALPASARPSGCNPASFVPPISFDDAAADAYGGIVAGAGYSRRKLLDRMIAAQALVHRATLVTDYADIDDLSLLKW